MNEEFRRSPYRLLVAKYSPDGHWLPYYAHLMDTAGIMERLLSQWLPAHVLENLSRRNPSVEWDRLCRFLALVHDIGKATPVFQAKICNRSPELKNRIMSCGIELSELSVFPGAARTPHAFAGEAILLDAGCPEGIAAVVGAHHGSACSVSSNPQDLLMYYEENFYGTKGESSAQGRLWSSIRESWIALALGDCGFQEIAELPEIDVPAQMILSGLLMMADWIASNEHYAPWIFLDEDATELRYPERTNQIWENVNLPDQWLPSCWFMDDALFQEKYGFLPNEMQRQVLRIVEEAQEPGIYIIEAQMGLGKTEAALAAAEILASRWQCEGVFWGLPTQATANGLFPRLKEWAERQADGSLLSIKLAHGAAMLQKEYRELFVGEARQNEDEEGGGLIVHSWFEGRKQALLSSFVVGTVDQLLMAALQQKHVMFRHLGLAGKVVVIDECHAYDAYMNRYLERALEWLGIYHVPVILLSATLPAKRRAKLLEAYHGAGFSEETEGWRENQAYPLLTYVNGDRIGQCAIPVDVPDRRVRVIRAAEADIADILKQKLAGGGCAGVIVNTVEAAQTIARSIEETKPDGYEVLLIHAGFTMADRQMIEEAIRKSVGKSFIPETRKVIVVGTQILEQSLDIDFDLLITQPAPMDLLLQRIGRLHRHGFRKRPDLLKEPVCIVCTESESEKASVRIYGEWLLRRTEQLLPEVIQIPDDISPLVQEAYRDMTEEEELYLSWENQMSEQKKKERKAESHRIPTEKELEETLHGILDSDINDSEESALARVRDTEPSISVLLMVQNADGTVGFPTEQNKGERIPAEQNKGERIPADHVPSEKECWKILLQKVQLPRILSVRSRYDACVRELEQQNRNNLAEWQQSRLLRGELVLLLAEDCTADLCGITLRYSEKYGVSYEKEG